MPFTVRDLVGKQQLITVAISDPLHVALNSMAEHSYSQLPVVDEHNRLIGIITSESILQALDSLQITIQELPLYDAIKHISDIDRETYRLDDDPFLLLNRLQNTDAVIITNAQRHPVGVITNADMAEWLRRRSQDSILVADIESKLKLYITYAFRDTTGQIDRANLDVAAAAAADHISRDARATFRKGLLSYLNRSKELRSQVDEGLLAEVLKQFYPNRTQSTDFDSLNFGDYIGMFLDGSRWDRYSKVFSQGREQLRTLLDRVRRTRNDLAHLRTEITASQRTHLQYCKNLLDRHESALREIFSVPHTQLSNVASETPRITERAAHPVIVPIRSAGSIDGNDGRNPEPSVELSPQTHRHQEQLPQLKTQTPRTNLGDTYWIVPAGSRPGISAEESLREWLRHGYWGMGESNPGRKLLKPGAQVCFYAAKVGVIARAMITGEANQLIPSHELPVSASGDALYRVPISDICWISPSVQIDAELRARLDAFQGKQPNAIWSWFIQTTRRISKRDFAILTRQELSR